MTGLPLSPFKKVYFHTHMPLTCTNTDQQLCFRRSDGLFDMGRYVGGVCQPQGSELLTCGKPFTAG
jgi:hypothetical protein